MRDQRDDERRALQRSGSSRCDPAEIVRECRLRCRRNNGARRHCIHCLKGSDVREPTFSRMIDGSAREKAHQRSLATEYIRRQRPSRDHCLNASRSAFHPKNNVDGTLVRSIHSTSSPELGARDSRCSLECSQIPLVRSDFRTEVSQTVRPLWHQPTFSPPSAARGSRRPHACIAKASIRRT